MEPVFIVAIVFGTLLAMTKMSIDHARWKLSNRQRPELPAGSASGDSLTTSELRQLIEQAVEHANQPLRQRIDELEEELVVRRTLPPASPHSA
ncbi:MAG: hypothetical protein SH809_03440 [Rhodothermales bacterium]|nr:hypothetical protein [Rhodothermales bacterium]